MTSDFAEYEQIISQIALLLFLQLIKASVLCLHKKTPSSKMVDSGPILCSKWKKVYVCL